MTPANGAIFGLAYLLGLLFSSMPWGGYILLALSIVAAAIVPALWRTGPRARIWLIAGIIGLLATFYLQARQPQPGADDISQRVSQSEGGSQEQLVTVRGKVASIPRLTRSQKAQFWFQARRLSEVEGNGGPAAMGEQATGKLYVTLPLLRATGLQPGQTIAVTGFLYKPKPAANPGAFDFKAYLARQGAFAGLKGRQIRLPDEELEQKWAWWRIRRRIIRSQVRWLGSPAGPLVSSMVMGRRAVDLPYDIRDRFIRVGLAHTLAASGFHVALLLGLVLGITRRLSRRAQFTFGTLALLIFVGLTGGQLSVLRATVMGFGALIALVTERAVKPLGSLLLAAIILLSIDPLWIWDVGFQFSFLATLGLIVTAPALMARLDWLPAAIASLVSVTLAAALWTLPLQLYVFGVVTPYSIPANILAAPFVIVTSIGGLISGLAALIWPFLGSTLARLLSLPANGLIGLVDFLSQLPGNSIAMGNISLLQLVALYGILLLIWWRPRWRKRWWFGVLLALGIVLIPVWQTRASLSRATILATPDDLILVIQRQGQVTLVNSGDINTARFTVLPFLQQQGINQIDWAISTNSKLDASSGWKEILEHLRIEQFYDGSTASSNETNGEATDEAGNGETDNEATDPRASAQPSLIQVVRSRQGQYKRLPIGETVQIGSTVCKLIVAQPSILQLQLDDQLWLFLGNVKPNRQKQLAITGRLPRVQGLGWAGGELTPEILETLQPEVAIASAKTIKSSTIDRLKQNKIQLYWTGRDGAIQWSPDRPDSEFKTTLDLDDDAAALL